MFGRTAKLHSSCTILYPHQQWMRVSISLYPHQHLLFSIFLIIATPVCVKWYLGILICISLITKDADHIFMCLSTICTSSLEKCLLKSFAHLHTALDYLSFYWVAKLCILNPSPLSYKRFSNIFIPTSNFWLPSIALIVSVFEAQKFSIVMKSNLSISSFIASECVLILFYFHKCPDN